MIDPEKAPPTWSYPPQEIFAFTRSDWPRISASPRHVLESSQSAWRIKTGAGIERALIAAVPFARGGASRLWVLSCADDELDSDDASLRWRITSEAEQVQESRHWDERQGSGASVRGTRVVQIGRAAPPQTIRDAPGYAPSRRRSPLIPTYSRSSGDAADGLSRYPGIGARTPPQLLNRTVGSKTFVKHLGEQREIALLFKNSTNSQNGGALFKKRDSCAARRDPAFGSVGGAMTDRGCRALRKGCGPMPNPKYLLAMNQQNARPLRRCTPPAAGK